MNSEVTVRRVRTEDIPAAAKLGAEIVRHHHRTNAQRFFLPEDVEQGYRGWLAQEIARPEAVVLLAERAGEIIGYCYGAIEPRDWNILLDGHGALHDLYVAPHARRTGVGKTLVRSLMNALTELGAPLLVLRVMVQNEPARRLAEEFGFQVTMLELARRAEKVEPEEG